MPTLAQGGRRPNGLQGLAVAHATDPPAREAGYQRLAAAVVRQALLDTRRPKERQSVTESIAHGTLGWWLDVAGVHEESNHAACAAILERTRGR